MTFRKAMLLTVGTGRDRKDIAQMLLDSIHVQNPSCAVFAVSRKTADETLPLVTPELERHGLTPERVILSDENDVQACTMEIRTALRSLVREYGAENVVVDFTSGTKPMSAAAFFAAMAERVATVIYMEGKRDQTGRVLPGTQTPRLVRPTTLFADMFHERGVWLFDHYHYAAAIELFEHQHDYSFSLEEQERARLFLALARAYAAWDRFDFDSACTHFAEVKPLRALLDTMPWAATVYQNEQALHREKNNAYSVWRLADLFNNAERRAAQGAWDDAVSRLYRAYEYMAQHELKKRCGIETKNVPVAELPAELKARYQYAIQTGTPVMLGARDAYLLLQHKCPTSPLVELLEGALKNEVMRLLTARNQSVLAHGFTTVASDTFQKLFKMLIDAADKTWAREFQHAREATRFPRLEPSQGAAL